jgi:hypothetical protein
LVAKSLTFVSVGGEQHVPGDVAMDDAASCAGRQRGEHLAADVARDRRTARRP